MFQVAYRYIFFKVNLIMLWLLNVHANIIEQPPQRSPLQFSPKRPKNRVGRFGAVGVYIRQEAFAKMAFLKMAFFKVDLKCSPMEQSLSRIINRFSWAIQIGCWKLHLEKLRILRDFEICQNRSRNSIFCFFIRLLVPRFKKTFSSS